MVYKLPKEAIGDNELDAGVLDSNLVNSFVPIGGIIMWSGTIAAAEALTNWRICDGQNGTPDLRDKFVLGVGSSVAASTATYNVGGGNNSITLSNGQMPSHNHSITDPGHSHTINNHDHSFSGSGSNTHNHNFQGVSGNDHNDDERNAVVMRNDSNTMYTATSPSGVQNKTISISISGTTGNPSDRGTNSVSAGITSQTEGNNESIDIRSQFLALCYIIRVT